jgi:hypothetical protein
MTATDFDKYWPLIASGRNLEQCDEDAGKIIDPEQCPVQ